MPGVSTFKSAGSNRLSSLASVSRSCSQSPLLSDGTEPSPTLLTLLTWGVAKDALKHRALYLPATCLQLHKGPEAEDSLLIYIDPAHAQERQPPGARYGALQMLSMLTPAPRGDDKTNAVDADARAPRGRQERACSPTCHGLEPLHCLRCTSRMHRQMLMAVGRCHTVYMCSSCHCTFICLAFAIKEKVHDIFLRVRRVACNKSTTGVACTV